MGKKITKSKNQHKKSETAFEDIQTEEKNKQTAEKYQNNNLFLPSTLNSRIQAQVKKQLPSLTPLVEPPARSPVFIHPPGWGTPTSSVSRETKTVLSRQV